MWSSYYHPYAGEERRSAVIDADDALLCDVDEYWETADADVQLCAHRRMTTMTRRSRL